MGDLVVHGPFVEQAHRLFAETGGQRRNLQGMAPRPAIGRDQRAVRSGLLVQMVENRAAFDQHLAVVEHQGRHPHQRVVAGDLGGIAENRPRAMLEGEAVYIQRDADAPHERRIILADQDHEFAPGNADGRDLLAPSATHRLVAAATRRNRETMADRKTPR